jgi:hypothetical protein
MSLDITLCAGGKCKKKETCYRFTAVAGTYQSYFAEPPVKGKKGAGKCDYYWPTQEELPLGDVKTPRKGKKK